MIYDPDKHHRRSIRLKGFDYSRSAVYFVTICVQNRECLLGEIFENQMLLNDAGEMVSKEQGNRTRFVTNGSQKKGNVLKYEN